MPDARDQELNSQQEMLLAASSYVAAMILFATQR
jgi:hypothetical protein